MSTVLPLDQTQLDQAINGRHGDPHSVLGAHVHDGAVTVRTFRPLAESVVVVHGSSRTALEHEYEGIWAGVLDVPDVPDYRLEVAYAGAPAYTVDDAYRYLPTLGEVDLHLINEGRHEQLWDVLGSHIRTYDSPTGPVRGASFAVWAPHAQGIRVKGDFNSWDGREHPMRQLGVSGVWELFVPDVSSGARYKFIVLGADDVWREKADPMAFHTEVPPAQSSVVYESAYTWNDDAWLAERAQGGAHEKPMSATRCTSARGGAVSPTPARGRLVPDPLESGFTHVEFLP